MAVYRVNKNRGYTVMANFHLRDKSLSLKAVGLLSKMLSFNDGWKFSTKGLSAICKEGPDAILSALRELEKHGYLVRHRQRDGKGRMSSTIFEIYEEPQESTPEREMPHTGNPCVEKPDVDNPHGDKSAQINTDQVITQERNTLSKNYQSINLDGMDRVDERSEYEEIIKENLDYDILCQDPKFDKDRFREIMDIMLDAVCSNAPTIRINGEDMPQQVVKSRFLKLNSSHIDYVFDAMRKSPSDIRNIRAYMLTALYNAPATIDNYYSALVNHDFYGQDRLAGSKKSKTYDYSLCQTAACTGVGRKKPPNAPKGCRAAGYRSQKRRMAAGSHPPFAGRIRKREVFLTASPPKIRCAGGSTLPCTCSIRLLPAWRRTLRRSAGSHRGTCPG